MKTLLRYFAVLVLATLLAGCAIGPGGSPAPGRDYFPGGAPSYNWGVGQSKANFANVERAQDEYSPYTTQRVWKDATAGGRASGTMLGLTAYYPLHVRWKLKDGREFMLENIDIRAIMREYFKTHDIQLQWQREGRARDGVGDLGPLLAHEVKDDTVLIKWVITTNHTPVNQRLTATGAATRWVFTDEEHLVTVIKGVPTSGIDFDKKWEFKTSRPQQ
jgi:hypothetical protein